MAPINPPLSPAELSYLHTSLSLHPPLRPDGRHATQFRPLIAETDVLPSTNGSARVCFPDGTEAVVGVKAEVERTSAPHGEPATRTRSGGEQQHHVEGDEEEHGEYEGDPGRAEWVEMSVEIPGGGGGGGGGGHQRGGGGEDEPMSVFLAAMLTEAVVADGDILARLRINRRWHWRVYVDILLLSPPHSYPLPLLSLTTHLALLATRLPRLISEADEDPLFDDDWEEAGFLYPRWKSPSHTTSSTTTTTTTTTTAGKEKEKRKVAAGSGGSVGGGGGSVGGRVGSRPPVTLLVMTVGENILFDPSAEELAVADCVLAISVSVSNVGHISEDDDDDEDEDDDQDGEEDGVGGGGGGGGRLGQIRLVAVRTIDPPSRMSAAGTPSSSASSSSSSTITTSSAGVGAGTATGGVALGEERGGGGGVWKPPRGGVKRALLSRMVAMVVTGDDHDDHDDHHHNGKRRRRRGGVAREVLDGLKGVHGI
ncbi:MAG: hypothetical protein M1837_006913 [Sclerophora amabilis]|nr:MAG: hypothetical protein M1837_006913 [Sclerophora amabilis]